MSESETKRLAVQGAVFKPEDFQIGAFASPLYFDLDKGALLNICKLIDQRCAETANALLPVLKKQWLEELLEGAPEVYKLEHSGVAWFNTSQRKDLGRAILKARLVAIEELGE